MYACVDAFKELSNSYYYNKLTVVAFVVKGTKRDITIVVVSTFKGERMLSTGFSLNIVFFP